MSFSGSKVVADINLDEFERRLRAAGALPTDADDPLLELARLVEAAARSASSSGAVAIPTEGDERRGALERGALRPALEEAVDSHRDPAEDYAPFEDHAHAEDEESHAPPVEDFHAHGNAPAQPARRRGLGWTVKVSALAIAGVGMIGAAFALKGGVPGLPKQAPFIAAAQGPTKVLPPSDDTVSTSNDAGATLLKDNTKSTPVKVVASEEQPVDLNALAPSSAPNAPAQAAAVAPTADSAGTAVKPTADAPVVVATAAPPPPAPSQFPDPKPVRTVSLRPDGTPIPTPVVASADAGAAAPVVEAAPPAKPAAKPTIGAASNAQPSSPQLQLPKKLSGKSSARVTVAKTDATAPNSIAEAANEPLPPAAKPAKGAKAQQAVAAAPEPQVATAAPAAPATPTDSAPQSDNPVLHALSALVGSNAAPAAPAAPPEQVDSVAATKSSGWAVQLAAPKSEAEANSEMAKLNAKYAAALNGSTIGVHKAVVNGGTIYRLRVVGLSKADAAALCARLKGEGRGCFIAR